MGISEPGVTLNEIIAKDRVFNWDVLNNSYIAIAGTWSRIPVGTYAIGDVLGNSAVAPGINDKVGLGSVYIPIDGTYEATTVAIKSSSQGIMHILLTNVDKASIDNYAAGSAPNTETTVTLGALVKGLYAVGVIVPDKNGASSNYNFHLQTMTINKTA